VKWRRAEFFMPRKERGKMRGALPRIPARGTPPETPAAFPFRFMFQNGPRRQGFASPRTNHAPLTAPGRSEDLPVTRERRQIQRQNLSSLAALSGLPLVGPELNNKFGVDKTS
jgi:hypothetical protein